ncbi:HlyD family secretion protein [Rhizobium sp. C4]|uniref:HlyD family secretion protein n=1 Tax=Rhizobium sp. C4 TaxID=1349800 RepID=UPI001E652726|nr:HlyD family secretion protein [Rhizobium sp. C4]MCD2175876.1 HlyD family secretion protein [Rhizobium sp. C4]
MAKNAGNAAVQLVDSDEAGETAREEATSKAAEADVRAEAKPVQSVADKKAAPRKSGRGRLVLGVIALAVLSGAAYYGHEWWTNGRFMVSTDDAYIGGDINYVAPKVGGYVKTVNVKANDYVKAGTPLVTLDDGDYRIALEQARAQLATQQLALKSIDAQRLVAVAAQQQAQAKLKASEATLHGAQLAQDRASKLQSQDVASASSLDKANVTLEQAQADVGASNAAIQSAVANIAATDAQHAQAESAIKSLQLAIEKAERDESFTVLRAPFDGIVGNLSVQEGDLVTPGMRLAAVVPSDALYIDANFKETQIGEIHPGQTVGIHVDALGDKHIEGKVLSISPASGAVFSLLPAENATGNFTKITQRLPVRISIPKDALETHRLMAGLSVVVDVDTRTTPSTPKTASAQ